MGDTRTTTSGVVHPAIHGRRTRKNVQRLFPRESHRHPDPKRSAEERARAMAAHPAGKGVRSASCGKSYAVAEGDSLWNIAADATDSRSAAVIARYWPTIYRENKGAIGDDPDLIFPGEVIELPECDR